MKWDTTDTSASFGGTASGKVSGTVSYEGGGSVLVIDVTSNFSANDTLTISGLSFAQFTATNTAAIALSVYTDGVNDVSANGSDDKTVTITGSLTLGEHTLSQMSNNFKFPNASNLELFRFKLTPAQEAMTVTSLTLSLQGIDGVTTADLTNLRLYRDMNSDGNYDAGDVQVGGAGALSITGQTGTVVWSTSFAATTTRDYIVVVALDNIRPGDALTMRLLPGNIVATGDLTSGTVVVAGSVESIQHMKGGAGSSGGGVGDDAPPGDGIRGGGGGGGGGGIDTDTGGTSLGDMVGFRAPSSHGSPQGGWTNGANGYNSDGAYATAASTNLRHTYGTFTFGVPSNNQITGIEVKLEGSGTTAAGSIEVALSWNNGSSITSYKTTGTLTATDAIYTLGGPGDTWGRSWTPDETADGTFTIEVRSQPSGNTVQIDAIRVRVYHQSTGGGGGGGGMVYVPRGGIPASILEFLATLGIDPRSLRGAYRLSTR
jgi:hypothetical protein